MILDILREELKKAVINKEEDKKNLLRVIIGESQRIGKDIDDNKMISILKSMMDNAMQMGNEIEIEILDLFMPRLLSEEEMESIIIKIIKDNEYSNMKDLGKIMKEMKDTYGSKYDGKIASSIAKDKLGFNAISKL